MHSKIIFKASASYTAVIAGLMVASVPAMAQTVPVDSTRAPDPQSGDSGKDDDIVVTGTLIRGIAPVGTNVIALDREAIVESGAVNTNDLLATLPQIDSFGTVPRGNQDVGSPLVRPSIRNLGASGATTTLLLLNGHRLVGAGINQTSADPSILPPGILQKIDVIPDGGSSIYGSDAIGGVINFITRKRFNGIEASGRYGFADNYKSVDGDLIVGRDWGSGSLYFSYSYAWHDNLLGADRGYSTADNTANGGTDFRSSACSPGNITIGAITYALPGRVANTINRCDDRKAFDLYPRERRHTVFGSLLQQLSPSIEFTMTGYWSRRDTQINTVQSVGPASGVIRSTNPYFQPVGAETSQTVAFSFASVFGPSNVTNQRFDSYGLTTSLNADLGSNWQIRGQANFGRSENIINEDMVNANAAAAALAGTTTATALNPYNLAATNSAVLAGIENYVNVSQGTQEIAEGRIVADGTLFDLPGGGVRLAFGGEYRFEDLASRQIQGPRGTPGGPYKLTTRTVKAVFGELLIPIVGANNGRPGLRSLTLSGSVRYDKYSDFGDTTNPKIGLTYEPFKDLKIRANYGTSFHAPDLASISVTPQVQVLPASPYRSATSPITDLFRPTILLAGGNPNLQPEEAKTWSAGFDWSPGGLPGLLLSATYYNVKFSNAIGLPNPAFLFTDPNYLPFYTVNPTLAQSLAAAGNYAIVGAPSIQALYVGTSPYLLADARANNFGMVKTDGIDFNLTYIHKFGGVIGHVGLAGNYVLDRDISNGPAGPFNDTLANGTSRLSLVGTLGLKTGGFTSRATLNYRRGYPIAGLTNQTRIDAFKTVDLYFGYDLPKRGLLNDMQITVHVDNLFNEDPPYANTALGFTNGSTLGRMVSFGIRKKF